MVCAFASISSGQMISVDGLHGYHTTPSARILAQGSFTLYGNNLPIYYSPEPDITNQSFNGGFNVSLFNNFEIGSNVSTILVEGDNIYVPRISAKYQFKQFTPSSPLLSIGVTDFLNTKNYIGNAFFVGSTEFYPFGSKVTLETGAVYQRYKSSIATQEVYTPIRAFLNLSLDYGYYSFNFENKLSNLGFELNQFFILRPTYNPRDPTASVLSLMLGRVATDHYPENMSPFVASIQFTQNLYSKNPEIERIKRRQGFIEPRIWLDIQPTFHMHYLDDFNYRLGIQSDIAIETGVPNLLWVNSFNFPLLKSDNSPLTPISFWSRRTVQYEIPRSYTNRYYYLDQPRIAFGYMEYNVRGALYNQRFRILDWRAGENTMGLINKEKETDTPFYFYNILTVPIHPPLSGAFENTQLYLEGGKYKNEELGGSLLIEQKLGHSVSGEMYSTYTKEKGFQAGLHVTFDFSDDLQKTFKYIHITASPTMRLNARYTMSETEFSLNEHKKLYDKIWEKSTVHANDGIDSSYYSRIIFCKDTITKECEQTDTDGDSIVDHLDACPLQAEDYDSIDDEDGCPDYDDDGDNIPDSLDLCKMVKEDLDGFEDQDGCPEDDNDQDGILDFEDQCVKDPEDIDGFEDADGCPDEDNDGDGVIDNFDRCINIPEDFDGVDDSDGCPEYIDDDSVPELVDNCPELSEDYDGFEDEDGCPEYDNDGDGIPDIKDKCPNKYEVFNSFSDEDGCPD